jgi:hypothetical protein
MPDIAKISASIMIEAMKETQAQQANVQGFWDGTEHYVRDLNQPTGQQIKWSVKAVKAKYDAQHAEMLIHLEYHRMKYVADWICENYPVTTKDI